MIFKKTGLQGNYLINIQKHEDERGFFARQFCEKEFSKNGLNTKWVQVNNSMNEKVGTLRGLHFQIKKPQGKLISVLKGEIFDVAVDIRKNSKTFGKHFSIRLSDKN